MNTPPPPSIPWDEGIQRLLKNCPDFAAAYLEVSAEGATDDFGRTIFLHALHRVAKFRGLAEVAEKAGMKPASLSRALSGRGNPRLKTLVSITHAIGMRLAVVPAEPPVPASKKRAAAKKPKRAAAHDATA